MLQRNGPTITFHGGLIGCPWWQEFVLLEADEDKTARVLQSLDEAGVSFLVIDPRDVRPDYDCELCDEDCEALQVSDASDVQLFSTITLDGGDPMQATVNLLGPLAINLKAGLGKQLILDGSGYSCRYPIGQSAARESEPSPSLATV